MSLLQINTAIPLAEPLLEQQQQEQQQERHNSTTEQHNGGKFMALGALTGFLIQIVSLGSYAFLLIHYQTKQVGYEQEDDASTTVVTLMSGLLNKQEDESQSSQEDQEVALNLAMTSLNTTAHTITYTLLSVLTQVDLVVYVLIWVAFTCTMTRNGMTCIRAQFFNSNDEEEEEDDDDDEESPPAVVSVTKRNSSTSHRSSSSIKRRYVFLLGVYFLVGIVSGAFLAWSAIDIYLGFPIPFKPILLTVTVDLVLCYCMVRCYDMGKKKKNNKNQLSPRNEEDDDEEIDFSLPSKNRGTEEVFLRRMYEIDPTLQEHVATGGDFVYVHESPPCPGFSQMNNNTVLHSSPPCQEYSSSQNMIIVD